jgi:Mg-chelatase subunit ChlD
MKKARLHISMIFVMALQTLSAAGSSLVLAETSPGATPSPPAPVEKSIKVPGDESGVDVVLLLDCSGKMKQIDPHDFRKPAAKLFISLLGQDDAISIIGFGDTAREIAPLTRNTLANREKLFSGIDNITAKEFNTNITEAVQKAFEKLKSSSRKNRVIILLSDGMLDLGSPVQNEKSYKELTRLLPEIAQAEIKIYAIAFTDLADMTFLSEAAAATNGASALAKSDKDLHVIFTSIFEKIKSPDALPLKGDGFLVDKNIQEIILLINKKPGTHTALTDPSGRGHTHENYGINIIWYESIAFDMITIAAPEIGTWKLKLSSTEGNKIFIITDLKLRSSFDRDFAAVGEIATLDAWLEKQGMLIREKEILEQVAFSAEVVMPDKKSVKLNLAGKNQSGGKPATGIYFGDISIPVHGEYRVALRAEGKTFQREKIFQFRAFEQAMVEKKQKRNTPAAESPNAQQDVILWKSVLIQFGLINLFLACAAVMVFISYRILAKRRTIVPPANEMQKGRTSSKEKKNDKG